MVVGTLSLVQKGQTSGCSGCGRCSGIAVYGSGEIVFGAKTSNQWMQWNIGIFGGDIVFGLTFLHQRQCSHHHIPLRPLDSSNLCVILTQPDFYHKH